jgi:uncharacterized coiled-coil DUF342 family protein
MSDSDNETPRCHEQATRDSRWNTQAVVKHYRMSKFIKGEAEAMFQKAAAMHEAAATLRQQADAMPRSSQTTFDCMRRADRLESKADNLHQQATTMRATAKKHKRCYKRLRSFIIE